MKILDNLFIEYIRQYSPHFLFSKFCPQSLDFYLPDYNTAIECRGRQHFIPIDYFVGKIEFEKSKERDVRKMF